ncbi:uncharacterized protein LOC142566209 [Dermacentor variabilis]|uniref:uncharacterized protein LOC142566209 n=1 Tax=Dermacentor variabilis TaxID=34621 RepID=UPI003F5B6B98
MRGWSSASQSSFIHVGIVADVDVAIHGTVISGVCSSSGGTSSRDEHSRGGGWQEPGSSPVYGSAHTDDAPVDRPARDGSSRLANARMVVCIAKLLWRHIQ